MLCAGSKPVNAGRLTPRGPRNTLAFDGRVPLRRALRAREGRSALPQALVRLRRGERVRGPGGPQGRPRGAPPRGPTGVPRRRLPLSSRPPRAARRRARRSRGVRQRQERRAVAAAQRLCRGRLRAADVPGHRHRHDRREEGRARLHGRQGRGAPLARDLRDLRAREPALLAEPAAHDVRGAELRDEPAGADRHLRDRRDGVPLPDAREGRRLGQQDLPVPGDARRPQSRDAREVPVREDEALRHRGLPALSPRVRDRRHLGRSLSQDREARLGARPRRPADEGRPRRRGVPRPGAGGGARRVRAPHRHRRPVRRQVLRARRPRHPAAAPRRLVPDRPGRLVLRRPQHPGEDRPRGDLARAAGARSGALPPRAPSTRCARSRR